MQSIGKITEELINRSPFLREAMTDDLINISALARTLKPELEEIIGKEVKEGAIVMAIKRMTPGLYHKLNIKITGLGSSIFVIIGGATIATCFDFILEPVAVKLHFWSWNNGQIPLFNYICWFTISTVLLGVKMYFKAIRFNVFATSLLIIQALFFLMLNHY